MADIGRAPHVLAALARGVLGSAYVPEIPQRMVATASLVASEKDRRQLFGLLNFLDTKPGALLLTGRAVPVSWLPPAAAEAVIQRWKSGKLPIHRQLSGIAITLATTSLYGYPCKEWDLIGYPGPLGDPPTAEKKLAPIEIDSDESIRCDVVIVGSGAGGGCAAAALAAAGLDVVVVEKGGYHSQSDFHHLESRAMHELYLYGGTLTTSDLGVRILAGSAVGGGTLVNYATAFKTPRYVLEDWERVSGVRSFTNGEIEDSLDEVAERIGITTKESAPGRRDQLMEEGLQKLGWHVDALPRAVRGCSQDANCGYCGFGCRIGAKQGTKKTYLEDATRDGARILTRTDVREVVVRDGRAVGIRGVSNGHDFTITARAVVAAGGAIETPALLLRSGLGGEVGKNIHLHPGTAPWGFFDEDVRMWEGTTQARYSSELVRWDDGWGPLFETVPIHPGAGSAATPWFGIEQHRELMGKLPRTSFCAVLPRDASSGRVRLNKDGSPRIDYKLNAEDQRRICEGVIAAAKVLEAAGANEINSPHPLRIAYTPKPGAHEKWADEVRQRGFAKDTTFFSYHQMSSCRMGMDPKSSAIGPDAQTHEVRDLYVMDASAFPTASGVNPMVSIYGIANLAAKKLAAKLS